LDEDLISAVQKRRALYDYRIPLKERGRLKKDDLWKDVNQYLKGKIYIYYIQGGPHFNPSSRISRNPSPGEKNFRQKLFGFEGAIRWYHWFDLEESFEGYVKVTSIF